MVVALSSELPPDEPKALAALQEHVRDCLDCDPGRSLHCHKGLVLHNRWARASQQQADE